MKSIKIKLLLSYSIVILCVTLIIGIVAMRTGYTSLQEQARNSLTLQASEGVKIVESRMEALLSSLTMVSMKNEIEDMGWEVNLDLLKEELEKTEFIDIGFVLPNGYTYYTDGTVRLMSDRSYVTDALAGKSEISDVIISRVTRKPEIEVAVPVYKDSKVVGAMVGRKEADSLSSLTMDLGYGEKGYAYMINESGTIIAHPDADKVLKKYNPISEAEKDSTLKDFSRALQLILREKQGNTQYKAEESSFYAGYASIEGTGWKLIITADQDEIMSSIWQMVRVILLVMAIVLAASFGIVLFLDSNLIRPLTEVTKQSKRLGALDISKNVEDIYLAQKDEIGTLANTFQILTDNLRNIILELTNSANEVTDTALQLTEASQQSAQASEDITHTMEEIARGANEQAKNTEAGLTQAMLLEQKISVNHQHMTHLNLTTDQVTKLVNEGLLGIDTLIRLSRENEAMMKNVNNMIDEIKNSSVQIGEASRIITDIAGQTGLLSLNAAIEAARAGDYGRGFAVVASEIQQMSDRSAKSSKYIDNIIKELQKNISVSADNMKLMTAASLEQQKSVSDTIHKFRDIADAMKNSEKAVSELNASEQDMELSNKEIMMMLQSLSSIAEQNAAGTQQTVSTMEEQTASVQILADVSDRLKQLAENLRVTVTQFQM